MNLKITKFSKKAGFLALFILFSTSAYFIYQKKADFFSVGQNKAGKSTTGKSPAQRQVASSTLETFEIKTRSQKWIEEGRQKYSLKDYASANKALSTLLNQYPYTGYKEEATCLLAQGLLNEGDWDQSEQVIHNLKEYSPDRQSTWWACALLTEGQIYEKRGQIDKAIKIYRQVIVSFPRDSEWVQQAEDSLMQISF